jgi:hypothetical protein
MNFDKHSPGDQQNLMTMLSTRDNEVLAKIH